MSVKVNLKPKVDLPVWEWLRPLPVATNATSNAPNMFAIGGEGGRYIYYLSGGTNGIFRYDTQSDSWGQITSSAYAQTTVAAACFNSSHGYFGRVISSPTTSTLQVGIPRGNKSVGLKIKIIAGTGAGQERTITSVANSVVADTMVVSTGSNVQIVDSNKNYTRNQYRDYIVRIIGNTNTDVRKVIWNSNNTLVFADFRFTVYGNRWAYAPLPYTTSTTAGSQTIAQIESNVITVDQPFTIQPDNTSQYVIKGGGIWNVNVAANRFAFNYYDILGDAWYVKSSAAGGLLNGNLATDVSISTSREDDIGVLKSGTASSGTSTTLVSSVSDLIVDQYKNYLIRIDSGTGAGQERLITSHSTNTFNVSPQWNIDPDNTSNFSIITDYEKIYMIGNAGSAMFQYDCAYDVWSDRRILEVGSPNVLCAVFNGYTLPIGISTITFSGTTATATTVNPHGLKTGETVKIFGATDSLYNITAAITVTGDSTFTYTMSGTPSANAVSAGSQSTAQLFDPVKNWPGIWVPFHGKALLYTTTSFTATGGFQQNIHHRLSSGAVSTNTVSFSGTPSSAVAPTSGSTLYYLTDVRQLGTYFGSGGFLNFANVSAATTTSISFATVIATANQYAGRRVIVTDGANWGESSISTNTINVLTLTPALPFTPTSNGSGIRVSILGNSPTGAGCKLEGLYGTSTLQKGRYMLGIRGAATNHFWLYDINNDTWEILGQLPNAETFTTGTMTEYDGKDRVYFHRDATGRIYYYDLTDNMVYNAGTVPHGMGAAVVGNRMGIIKTEDDLTYLYIARHSGQEFWRVLLFL